MKGSEFREYSSRDAWKGLKMRSSTRCSDATILDWPSALLEELDDQILDLFGDLVASIMPIVFDYRAP